jgi:hypothetical protein
VRAFNGDDTFMGAPYFQGYEPSDPLVSLLFGDVAGLPPLFFTASQGDALSETMAVTAAGMDLSCFAYLALPYLHDKQPLVILMYPVSWAEHYLRNNYERLDPVIVQALRDPEPFRWGSDTANGGRPQKKWRAAHAPKTGSINWEE